MNSKGTYTAARPIAIAILLSIFFAAGYQLGLIIQEKKHHHAQIRQDGYQFISPLLECESRHSSSTHPNIRLLKQAVQHVVDMHLADHSAGSISFYFRDLMNGSSFGINELEKFTPSSLLKVPLMIAVLKNAEHDDGFLRKKIKYTGEEDTARFQEVKPREGLHPGSWYTVEDLIFRTIAYSDNNAAMLLADNGGMEMMAELMAALRIPVDTGKRDNLITIRDYSAFFRVLFNASYLDDHQSEQALAYLARSAFQDGLRAGVPPEMPVASKFGEYSAGAYQLHEFGIVYYPEHPYLLGIVTKQGTYESLTHVIGELSRCVYREFERQHNVETP